MVDLDLRVDQAPLAYIDLETTGLDPAHGDRVIEIGLLRTNGKVVEVEWDQLVDPGRPVSYGAYRVNHISDEMLVGAPLFAQVADELLALVQDTVVVAHNAPFDLGFLKSELTYAQRPLPSVIVLDTVRLARAHVTAPSYSLQALCEMYGIENEDPHRALGDARATRELFVRLTRLLAVRGIRTVSDMIRAQGGPLLDRSRSDIAIPDVLRTAMRSGKRMRIRYRDGRGVLTERVISPIQVTNRFGVLYLVAHCHLRNASRTFAIDRIEEMAMVDEIQEGEL